MLPLFLGLILLIFILFFLLPWLNADHPQDNGELPIFCAPHAPMLRHGQKIKIMTYNIQFLAGKNYVFFHDVPDLSGKDSVVSTKDVLVTADGIAQVIIDEMPDFICLQEIDDGSRRTGYVDQLKLLLDRLPSEYCCYTSAFYWKVKFIPHPKIFGPLGMKTAIISKYKIDRAVRRNLPSLPLNFFLSQFSGKKLILQAFLSVDDGSQLSVMSTHLDAFTVGSDIMTSQLKSVRAQAGFLNKKGIRWVLAGDFNLLPPGQYEKLEISHRAYYNPDTEIKGFYEEHNIVPPLIDVMQEPADKWFTYSGNDPKLKGPDRTLDYIVYSDNLKFLEGYVRQSDTRALSDHLPVIAVLSL